MVPASQGGWEDYQIMHFAAPGRMSGTHQAWLQWQRWWWSTQRSSGSLELLSPGSSSGLPLPWLGAFFLGSDWLLCEISRSPRARASWSPSLYCQFPFLDWILPQSVSSAAMGWILPSEDKSLKFNPINHLLGFPETTAPALSWARGGPMSGCSLPSAPTVPVVPAGCSLQPLSLGSTLLPTVLQCSDTPHFAVTHHSLPTLPFYSLSSRCQKKKKKITLEKLVCKGSIQLVLH